jgi:hypothetical protein
LVTRKFGLNNGFVDVRFGSEADMCSAKRHVRFTPNSDIKRDIMEGPLWANSAYLFDQLVGAQSEG